MWDEDIKAVSKFIAKYIPDLESKPSIVEMFLHCEYPTLQHTQLLCYNWGIDIVVISMKFGTIIRNEAKFRT